MYEGCKTVNKYVIFNLQLYSLLQIKLCDEMNLSRCLNTFLVLFVKIFVYFPVLE